MEKIENKNGFSIGDRVYLCKTAYGAPLGLTGIIRCFRNNSVLVEFESSMPFFHSGGGMCAEYHGYWVLYDSIRKEDIDENLDICNMNIDDFYNNLKLQNEACV